MVDIVSKAKRSEMMAGIKGKDTKPELIVRKALHKRGFRYKLHDKNLPGKPDLVLTKYKTVIQVHGCYWHGHENCHLFRYPKSKTAFWKEKIGKNIARDKNNEKALLENGWRIVKIWECSLKGREKLERDDIILLIDQFLRRGDNAFLEIRGGIKSQ